MNFLSMISIPFHIILEYSHNFVSVERNVGWDKFEFSKELFRMGV